MGIFSQSSPFDAEVEKATDENNTSENWGHIMEICDTVGNSSQKAKDCLKAIIKRLNAADPHIVMQAITLLDACSSNCGKSFHLEIASREFEGELKKLLSRTQPKIVEKTKILLKKWAEGDFKTDSELNLIPSLYNKLKSEGHDFSSLVEMPRNSQSASSSASANREDQDIARAIELSLKESKQYDTNSSHSSPAFGKVSSLYPNVNSSFTTSSTPEPRKVRALYDFEAAEDNELSFAAGDIIHILDDSDANWWKGAKGKMEGLFPSNFVTADLSVELEHITKLEQGTKKTVQFAEEVEVKTLKREPEVIEVEIDESKMDRLLHLLHEADPQSDVNDPPEMLDLEEQVTAMGPLIDAALEKVDRRHAQLTQLSSNLVDALNLYHTFNREPSSPSSYNLSKMPPHMNVYPYPNQPHQPPQMFNGMPPTNYPQSGMPPGAYVNAMPPQNEYMTHHNMQPMAMPQYNPHQTQMHPQVPPLRHPPPPSAHPHPVHSQVHPQIHPPVQMSPQNHPPSLPPQTQEQNLPYHPQGYLPQNVHMPVQYVPQGPQQPLNQPTQYVPPSNEQRMM